MRVTLERKSTVTKVLNNNIILVKDKGIEKIIFLKGIGFNKKFGDIIEAGIEVDKIFSIENQQNQQNLKEVYEKIDSRFIVICEEGIAEISEDIGEELNESIHIALIDHLALAIKRIKKKETIENPFTVEIETLYSREFELARKLAERIQNEYKLVFPEDEIGFITLHIHSARNNGKLSNTIKYSYLGNSVIEHVEDALDIEIDRKSLDYGRFLTHIRFAMERILTDNRLKNDLTEIIKVKYSLSYMISKEIAEMIEEQLEKEVTDDEVAYLAMHIERFRVSFNLKENL